MRTRWKVNISPAERAGRILVGAVAAIAAAVLLVGAPSTTAVVLELLLLLAGLDLVVTGALGHCPLYARIRPTAAPLREEAR